MVHVDSITSFEDGTSPGWSHVKVSVTSAGVPGTVQVRVLSVTDGVLPPSSHDIFLD